MLNIALLQDKRNPFVSTVKSVKIYITNNVNNIMNIIRWKKLAMNLLN